MRDDVIGDGTTRAQGETPFLTVDLSDRVLDHLAQQPSASLVAHFGDYRPSPGGKIGIGDTVQVTIYESAAGGLFTSAADDRSSSGSRSAVIPEQVIGRDGAITVPYAGRVSVLNRTQPEVEEVIVDRLKGKAINPQVVVNVTHNISNTVTVSGEVTGGTRVPLSQRGDRLMDVIASAGGFHSAPYETYINLSRGGQTARLSIETLLRNPKENIFARPGDVIVLERSPRTFTTSGATGANAVIPFEAATMSLEEAIGRSGGLQDYRADPAGVFVFRYEPKAIAKDYPNASPSLFARPLVPVAYHLNLREPSAMFHARRFAMHSGDILYVSNSNLTEVSKFLQLFQAATSPGIQTIQVGSAIK